MYSTLIIPPAMTTLQNMLTTLQSISKSAVIEENAVETSPAIDSNTTPMTSTTTDECK